MLVATSKNDHIKGQTMTISMTVSAIDIGGGMKGIAWPGKIMSRNLRDNYAKITVT
jgi:hypothetical protein